MSAENILVEKPLNVTPKKLEKMRRISREKGVKLESVRQLWAYGVEMNDIRQVLELREALTKRNIETQNVIAAPTIEAIANAYLRCESDVDALEGVVDIAYDLLSQESQKRGNWAKRNYSDELSIINNSLKRALKAYIIGEDIL